MDIKKIISRMTLEEKITFCTGGDFWHTKAMPQYGVPAIMMSDGPHGLRCQTDAADMIGINDSLLATCFPAAVTAGATWNKELYAAEGEAIGKDGAAAGVAVVLGPGCNIKRNPLGGRNFEYISEDPVFSGKMAAAFIQGQQSAEMSSSVKHFAVNNQEYKRQNGDSQLDERILREIYLTPFEIAVKESKPGTVMCSYNKVNGLHVSDSKELLTDILRAEWGFDGLVVTDWGALYDRIEGFKAGCDLNMPGGSRFMEKATAEAVRSDKLDEKDIDASVERLLRLIDKSQRIDVPKIDWDAHHALALKVAEQGAVLLKNDDNILPLKEEDMVLIGHMAKEMRYQGSGSSHINPKKLVNLTDALPDVPHFACGDDKGNVTGQDLKEAAEAAKRQKIAVVVVGLPESYESEAFDRDHMGLPDGHNALVEAVTAANPNTVVVMHGGSAMELPWADGWKVPAGTYTVLIGASSRDIRLQQAVAIAGEEVAAPAWQAGSWYENLSGEPSRETWERLMGHPVPIQAEPKKGQFTMDSTCMEMKDASLVMKIQYMVTENIIAKGFGGKKDLSDPSYRMMLTCATDCPMRSVVISSGGAMSDSLAQGLLHMANGHRAEPAEVYPNSWTDMVSPHPEVSTAYTSYVMGCMAEIAEELDHNEDAASFKKYSEGCRKAYQAMTETADYTLDTDRQARLVRPLAFDLLDEEQTDYARNRLIQALENYGWRLGTGFLSTPLILDVLARYDLDAAYRLLENEQMPGWLFMPKNGATTIWESWEGTQAQGGIASLNHYSKGAVCEWLFKTMCGIRVEGENHFVIRPRPGGSFTYAKAAYESVYGRVESGWHKEEDGVTFHIVIPANCTADLRLPGRRPETLQTGTYHIRA